MELRQLEHFVAVADEQHFTRAAARVHVVQSSLSASIKALEGELGELLFVRDNRRVTMTEAGRALLPSARAVLAAVDEGRDAVAGLQGVLRGHLHVGAIQTLGVVDLAALLADFRKAHSGVTVRLNWGTAADLARAVVDGELDIAFIDGPVDRAKLMTTDLGHDALVLAMRRDDPLAHRRTIRLSDAALRDREFVEYGARSGLRAQIDAACARSKLARRIACEVNNMQYLVEMVRSGAGLSLLPPAAIRPVHDDVIGIPVVPALRRDMCAVVPLGRPPLSAARALLDLLTNKSKTSGASRET
jgi:DNA-binding transcriptional LysR family regulator